VENDKKIILFDGVCNLCNGAVQFIIKRDKNEIFQFAPLQGVIGKKLTSERNIDVGKVDSIILIEPGNAYYIKSDAVLKIGMELRLYGTISYVLNLIPSTLRNIVYDFIARNRYKWYGKKVVCMVPSAALKNRFLE
jgi:predicted DCC family thiol-disulfide oxidoreductase YuxK